MGGAPYGMDVFQADPDEAGIHFDEFVSALQIWCVLNWTEATPVTVRRAARAFRVTDDVIRRAVEQGYYMFLRGPGDDATRQIIEVDGA